MEFTMHRSRTRLTDMVLACSASAALLSLGACGSKDKDTLAEDARDADAALDLDQLRSRATAHFANIDMYKPSAPADSSLDVYMAPMMYREVVTGEADPFGALVKTDESWKLDLAKPTVYFQRSNVQVNGTEHKQLAFLWFYPAEAKCGIEAQGVRMTFDQKGYPAIFEVLADSSGASVFYVTKSLEESAQAANGPALAGRTFSMEPDIALRPDVVVIQLVSEGGAPLGPILYDAEEGRDLWNLHCRCSPSQITSILASVEYELLPLRELPECVRTFEASTWAFDSLRLPPVF